MTIGEIVDTYSPILQIIIAFIVGVGSIAVWGGITSLIMLIEHKISERKNVIK